MVAQRTAGTVERIDSSDDERAVRERIGQVLAEPLTAEGAVRIALLNNRDLQAFYSMMGLAQADLVQAGLLPNPIVDGVLRFGFNGAGTGFEGAIVQEFLTIVQIPLRKRVAEAAFEAAKLQVVAAAVDLAGRVKAAFYHLQGSEQTLEMHRVVMTAFALGAETSERQHEAGNITDLELANEQALYQQARIDLAQAEIEELERREDLNALMGLWGRETMWTVGTRLPEPPASDEALGDLESLAVSQRLDLAAARQQIEVANRELRIAEIFRFLPFLELGFGSEREPESGIWHGGPFVALPLPIFDQQQGPVARGREELRERRFRYDGLAVDIRADVRRRRDRLHAARRRAAYYRDVLLPLRHEIVRQSQLEYNGMLIGVFQLLLAKREEVDAGRAYVETLADYWITRAELERAVGGELPLAASDPVPRILPEPVPPSGGESGPMHHHGG